MVRSHCRFIHTHHCIRGMFDGIIIEQLDVRSMSHTNNKNNNEDNEDGDGEGGISQSGTVLATLQLLRVDDPTLLIPCLDAIG
eukprot:scaffold15418_cov434-Alexandrium_tamarense.AAC.1